MNDIVEIKKQDICQTPEAIYLSLKTGKSDEYLEKTLNILNNQGGKLTIFKDIEDLKKYLFDRESIEGLDYNIENVRKISDIFLDVFFDKSNPKIKQIDRKVFERFLILLQSTKVLNSDDLINSIKENSKAILERTARRDRLFLRKKKYDLNHSNHDYETNFLVKELLKFNPNDFSMNIMGLSELDNDIIYKYATSNEVSDIEKRVIFDNIYMTNLSKQQQVDMFASMEKDKQKMWFLTRQPSFIKDYGEDCKKIFSSLKDFENKKKILEDDEYKKLLNSEDLSFLKVDFSDYPDYISDYISNLEKKRNSFKNLFKV